MAVQNKVLYAFRGWIAFVAFMDLGTAGRSYIERRSFLGNSGDSEQLDGEIQPLIVFMFLKYIRIFKLNTYLPNYLKSNQKFDHTSLFFSFL